ncbi:major facilitator superfamily domain-containing protein [Aspergillus leporis]|uniref:Major facilitator superfamily domain-containing protein n=1 Tax=Aspergillus leporis TaxID=41062 RepID=A0A5N5WWF8_9EURO|nr:major facilitator superfamily domain-containing protein [Aspergillus leporis]
MGETNKNIEPTDSDTLSDPSNTCHDKPMLFREEERLSLTGKDLELDTFQSRSVEVDLEHQAVSDAEIDNEANGSNTAHLQHAFNANENVKSLTPKTSLPRFGRGMPYPPQIPNSDDYLVDFEGPDDPWFPQNWSSWQKLFIGAILAFTCLSSTFDSAILSASASSIAKHFGVSLEVVALSSSLYIAGYALGPLLWAPLSELYGRRLPIILGMFGFSIFSTAVAVSKDLQTLMICRFFSGVFGSSPLIIVAAAFSDMYDNRTRGIAIAIFAQMVFLGPLIAPFIGGFIVRSYLGWRWTAYIPAIMGYTATLLTIFFLNESYPPVILATKAKELRHELSNWAIHAKLEETDVGIRELIVNNFSRPLQMLIKEPLILAVTVYLSFIYGLLYCFLSEYTSIFQGVYGMAPGLGGLPLFGIVVGLVIGALYMVYASRVYNTRLDANNGIPIPEWRLPPVVAGGVLFSAGLFWLGWTGFTSSIHWIVPTLSGLFTGAGLLIIFIQLFNYLLDTYLMYAASALAANTICRSLVAASFPLFSRQMFANMGIQWASTLLGCVSAVLVPIPVLFLMYGKQLRKKSHFAPVRDGS